MRIHLRPAPYAAAMLLMLVASGCKDVSGPDTDSVSHVTVWGATRSVEVGSTLQLGATVLNSTGGAISSPQVTWRSSDETVATVSTSGMVTGVAPGAADITATSGGKSGFVRVDVVSPPCESGVRHGSISVGQTRTAQLTTTDCVLFEGPYAHAWRLHLAAPTPVAIDLTSNDFDALLFLSTEQMELVGYNDDGGEGTNARLLQMLPAGDYVVWATVFSPGTTGGYTLSIGTFEPGSCDEVLGTISVNEAVGGTLDGSGCMLEDGRLADPWALSFSAATAVQIDLVSLEFDAYLVVTDADGNEVVADDDGGMHVDARIAHTFAPGNYTVWATTYAPGMTGSYELAVAPGSAGSAMPSLGSDAKVPAGAHTHPFGVPRVKPTPR